MPICPNCEKESSVLFRDRPKGENAKFVCPLCVPDNMQADLMADPLFQGALDRGEITPLIKKTPPAECELCGTSAELRPYRPNDENICMECGMKDRATTERKMGERFFGRVEGKS